VQEFLAPGISGYIITSFLFPSDPKFNFEKFYSKLNEQDLVIYPGKVRVGMCFPPS
jgi:2-aminoethylphosphonate-pyruvate transaminase